MTYSEMMIPVLYEKLMKMGHLVTYKCVSDPPAISQSDALMENEMTCRRGQITQASVEEVWFDGRRFKRRQREPAEEQV